MKQRQKKSRTLYNLLVEAVMRNDNYDFIIQNNQKGVKATHESNVAWNKAAKFCVMKGNTQPGPSQAGGPVGPGLPI